MADVGHFGCPNLTFDRISGLSDQYATLVFFEIFDKMSDVGHFRCPNFAFDRISGHFRSIRNFFLNFVYKMAAVGHFGCPKFTLDHISGHFRTIHIFNFFGIFTKWLPVAILDGRKSLSISFLSISHWYATLIFLRFLIKWLTSAILDVRI